MPGIGALVKASTGGLFILGYLGLIKPLQFYTRALVYVLLLAVSGFYGTCASIVLTLIGKQGLAQWTTARVFYTMCRVLLGIKVNIKNRERLDNNRPAVFIANHQSELDILLLGATFPKYCSVTAKKSLKYYPFLGWFMALSGTIFLDRKNRNEAISIFASASKKMQEKRQSVFLFPEGTRSYYQTPGLLPFKKGAFHLAVESQVPLVPFIVCNYSKVFSFEKRRFVPGSIDVEVLEPIETKGLGKDDVKNLYEETEKLMQAAVKRIGYGSEYSSDSEGETGATSSNTNPEEVPLRQ